MKVSRIFCGDNGEPSMRRSLAFVLVLVICVAYLHSQFSGKEMPSCTEFVMGAVVTMVCSEPVVKAFNKKGYEDNGTSTSNDNAEPQE